MSFSQTVKEEVLKNIKKFKGCCATSFLTAVLKSIGSLHLDSNGFGFSVESDNGELLMLCSSLAQTHFSCESTILKISGNDDAMGKNAKYVCRFDVALGEKLRLAHTKDGSLHLAEKPELRLKDSCCRRAFMQALFLSCGSATVPEGNEGALSESQHSNYHLELRLSNEVFADFVLERFPELGFKKTLRKNSVVLYIKDSGKISDFFAYVDAINAKFAVENIIIGRSFRNTANRQRNCIDSNIDKSIQAASRQLAAIQKIRQKGAFQNLPQQLKDVAEIREQNHEANLAELASILHISKSGVNHRLEKLIEISQNL